MTDITAEHDAELAAAAALDERHEHPSDRTYVMVALALGVLTAIEVALYYLKNSKAITVTLLSLMVIKFFIVATMFMHLRFDSKVLRGFFLIGLTLAVILYSVVLFMFGIFHV